jgi:hypothetical protein
LTEREESVVLFISLLYVLIQDIWKKKQVWKRNKFDFGEGMFEIPERNPRKSESNCVFIH